MKIKVITGIGAFIIVVVATTALFIRGKQHPMEFPKSSWAPATRGPAIPAAAGKTDPPLALATILLDASKGDGEKLLSDLSPAMQGKLQRQFGKQIQAQGISLAQLVSQMGAH